MTNFSTDNRYLLNYELRNSIIYSLIITAVLLSSPFSRSFIEGVAWYLLPMFLISFYHFGVSLVGVALYVGVAAYLGRVSFLPVDVIVVIAGVLLGLKSAMWMHNAAHRNFAWPWLSTAMGELCAIQQLIGYRPWQIAHFIHHKYPDDPAMDPHPPMYDGFFRYMLKMKYNIAQKFDSYYFSHFTRTPDNQRLFGLGGLVMLISILLRTLLWYVLLGPKYYLLFFVISNIATNIMYASFNYFTHRPNVMEKGKFDILDLNAGVFRILNWITAGSFFHGTHHKRPNLYNPGGFAQQMMVCK